MGFFDAITSSTFKKSKKGHWLFFPWGPLGPGYVIYAESLYKQLRRKIIIFYMVSFPIIFLGISFQNPFFKGIFIVLALTASIVWINRLCRRMIATDEKLTFKESFNNQAAAHNLIMLWLLVIFSTAFVIASFYILFNNPDKWLIAVLGLIFFGFAAGFFVKMIISRRNLRKKEPDI